MTDTISRIMKIRDGMTPDADAKAIIEREIAALQPRSSPDIATLDEALKGIMFRLFCEIQGMPPTDTQLEKIDVEFTRMIDEYRNEPEYLAALRASQPATTTGGEATKEAQKRYPDDADDYGHPESLKHLRDAFMAGASFEKETSARSSADSEQPDARYWEFRQKVESLVFDPIRRGGRVEDEILSELERMSQRDAEALRAPDPAQSSQQLREAVAAAHAAFEAIPIGYPLQQNGRTIDHTLLNEAKRLCEQAVALPSTDRRYDETGEEYEARVGRLDISSRLKICSVCGAKHPVGEK